MPLADDVRAALHRLLLERPGSSTRALASEMGLSESTVAYHLQRLVALGEASSTIVGRSRCWYARGCGLCPVLRRAVPTLRRAGVREVAAALGDTPLTAPELAERTGVSLGAARWAAQELAHSFLAERTRGGRTQLRNGAEVCMTKALVGEPCERWGSCAVSEAWRASLVPTSGGVSKQELVRSS
ncbi:MAG TPA: winged helix-turn-helix transcriptional regulator [Candidatus Thermoplasmatota archaeon]|nr:winged helix-turn-helix transcriptional regulator [Candidatus Thermoplasmatota archaeon]